LQSIENKIERYTERIWKTEDEDLISNYENELKKLYYEKDEILYKIEDDKIPIQTTKRINYDLIRNALQVWRNGNLEERKKLLRNIFPEGIPVDEERHLQTPILSLVYQIFEVWKYDDSRMVHLIWQNLNQLY
jgi:hypothetical protein